MSGVTYDERATEGGGQTWWAVAVNETPPKRTRWWAVAVCVVALGAAVGTAELLGWTNGWVGKGLLVASVLLTALVTLVTRHLPDATRKQAVVGAGLVVLVFAGALGASWKWGREVPAINRKDPEIRVVVRPNEELPYDPSLPEGCNDACSNGLGIIPPVFLVPTEGPPDTLPADVDSWVKDNGGIPAYGQLIRLEISSTDETDVIINGVDAHVIGRKPPPRGWFVLQEDPSCGGGELESLPVEIDLSRLDPAPDYIGWPLDKWGRPKPLRANKDFTQIIDIYAKPGPSLVEWELVVDYSLDGRGDQYRVKPLRVTGLLPKRANAYQPNNIYQQDNVPLKSLDPTKAPDLGDPPVVAC